MISLSFRAVYRIVYSDGTVGGWYPVDACNDCDAPVTYESREQLESAIGNFEISAETVYAGSFGATLEFRRIAIYEGIIE